MEIDFSLSPMGESASVCVCLFRWTFSCSLIALLFLYQSSPSEVFLRSTQTFMFFNCYSYRSGFLLFFFLFVFIHRSFPIIKSFRNEFFLLLFFLSVDRLSFDSSDYSSFLRRHRPLWKRKTYALSFSVKCALGLLCNICCSSQALLSSFTIIIFYYR